MKSSILPIGKLPADLLAQMLARAPIHDPRVLEGPGIGMDCAVIDNGDTCLVFKTDPITFVSDAIGWYVVQINANDIATAGAEPRWFLCTSLLPEGKTTPELVQHISDQIYQACREKNIAFVGGHTEITHGIDRPILVGTLVGEVARHRLVTPRGAAPGDAVLLTKGIPIEATAILAREFPQRLCGILSEEEITEAADYLFKPGISVVRDARLAQQAGRVTAMHDPTEGGLAASLWEVAEASGRRLVIDPSAIPIPSLSARICRVFDLNPLATIASGALLMTVESRDSAAICRALQSEGIDCRQIGRVEDGEFGAWTEENGVQTPLSRPQRDDIGKVYE